MRNIFKLTLVVMASLLLASCGENPHHHGHDGKITVFVGIQPIKYLLEQIGGDMISVEVMVPPGREPHDYEPTPRQMLALGKAKAYFSCGVPFETTLLDKIRGMGLKNLKIFHLEKGVTKVPIEKHLAGHVGEFEDHDHHHGEGSLDPHIWLSPMLIRKMAENAASDLTKLEPAEKEELDANLKNFLTKLDDIDSKLKKQLAQFKGRNFLVFHPAFGYFADHYGLKQNAVEIEGKRPTPKQIQNIIKIAKTDNIRIIFVQPQFDRKSAEAVAKAIHGVVVPLDPLKENLLENLETISTEIEKGLHGK